MKIRRKLFAFFMVFVFLVSLSVGGTTVNAVTKKSISLHKAGNTQKINSSFEVKSFKISNGNIISFDKKTLKIKAKAAGTAHLHVYNNTQTTKASKHIDYAITVNVITTSSDKDKWNNQPIVGTTVWPVKDIPLYKTSKLQTKVGILDAVCTKKVGNKNKTLLRKAVIEDINGGVIKVKGYQVVNGKTKSITGWASSSTNFYVNMAQVNTNIKYNITNAYKSIFVIGDGSKYFKTNNTNYKPSTNTVGVNKCETKPYNTKNPESKYKNSYCKLANITNAKLYSYDSYDGKVDGKVYSKKLKKEIFVVPILWKFARELGFAECVAERNGYNLKIYDTYRPQYVCNTFYSSAKGATSSGAGRSLVTRTVAGTSWGLGWFVADPSYSTSDHARGVAADLTLQYKGTNTEISTQSNMHDLSCNSIKNVGSSWNTDKTNVLHKIMVTSNAKKVSLTSLASEWWHFNLSNSYSYTTTYYNVDY